MSTIWGISERTIRFREISCTFFQKVSWLSSVTLILQFFAQKNAIPKKTTKNFHRLPCNWLFGASPEIASANHSLGLDQNFNRVQLGCGPQSLDAYVFPQPATMALKGCIDQKCIQRGGSGALQPSSKLDTSFLPMERT